MLNSQRKGYRAEIEYRDLLNKIFGSRVRRQFASGAFASWKGDLMPMTLPEVLKDYGQEVKYEKKPRLFAYIRQCQREFNSKSAWQIAYRTPADLGIPENFVIIMPAVELLGLLKELQDYREGNNG